MSDHEDGADDFDDEDGPARPQKKYFRTRAHSNVLNANDFWFPTNPDAVPIAEYYPGLVAAGASAQIEMVDIGCGYGSLLLELAQLYPAAPMLGIEIRPKIVEYVQKKVVALRYEARAGASAGSTSATGAAAPSAAAGVNYENVWAVHNNAMRFLPNFFRKEQLSKLFFCFADPHFKRKNHRKRVISTALLAEYAYVLQPGGLAYVITDVAELMEWMVGHFSSTPLFERVTREDCASDPTVRVLTKTDEGLKVTRNNGNMYIAVFRKRPDPLAPAPPALPNDNAYAAETAADAGYRPLPGGERRGMTW
jgi:tRNA (guanine-N7-)-methyltransferase